MACMRRAGSRDRERVAAGACAQAHAHESHALHAAPGPAASLLRLHRDFGNRGVGRMLRGRALPAKGVSPEPVEDADGAKPDPKNGSATIKCDGKGDYEILLGSWATATCGTKDCVIKHESSHMKDWKAKWPNGCKNQPKGYLPKGDPPDEVLMTAAEYNAFLKQSECTAHTVDLACANALPQPAGCEQTVKDYIKLTADQKKNYC
jgi:hypothetical protein